MSLEPVKDQKGISHGQSPRTKRLSLNLRGRKVVEKKGHGDSRVAQVTSPRGLRKGRIHKDGDDRAKNEADLFGKQVKNLFKKNFSTAFDLACLDQVPVPISLSKPAQIIHTFRSDPGTITINTKERTFPLDNYSSRAFLAAFINCLEKEIELTSEVEPQAQVEILLKKSGVPEEWETLFTKVFENEEMCQFGEETRLCLQVGALEQMTPNLRLEEAPSKKEFLDLLGKVFSQKQQVIEKKKAAFIPLLTRLEKQFKEDASFNPKALEPHLDFVWHSYCSLLQKGPVQDLPKRFTAECSRIHFHEETKKSVPTLSLLKAVSFCSWGYVDHHLRETCPELFASSPINREEGKIYLEDSGSTEYQIETFPHSFSVTQCKAYSFGPYSSQTGKIERQGGMTVQWLAEGKLGSDVYSAQLRILDVTLPEKYSTKGFNQLRAAFGVDMMRSPMNSPRFRKKHSFSPHTVVSRSRESGGTTLRRGDSQLREAIEQQAKAFSRGFELSSLDIVQRPIYLGSPKDIQDSFRSFWKDSSEGIEVNNRLQTVVDYSDIKVEEKERPTHYLAQLIDLLQTIWEVEGEESPTDQVTCLLKGVEVPKEDLLKGVLEKVCGLLGKGDDISLLVEKFRSVGEEKGLQEELLDRIGGLLEDHAAYVRHILDTTVYSWSEALMKEVLLLLLPLGEQKAKIPLLPILKAMNFTAYAFAEMGWLRKKVCPALFKEGSDVSLSSSPLDTIGYKVKLKGNQTDFSVTHMRTYRIHSKREGVDGKPQQVPIGSLEVHWKLFGKIGSDRYGAEFSIPTVSLSEGCSQADIRALTRAFSHSK